MTTMPDSRRLPTFTRRFQLRAAALVLGIAVLPSAACGYQLALQPTTTPAAGPLGVRQITPQAKQVDPAALVAQAAPVAPAQGENVAQAAPAQAQPNAPLVAAAAPAAPAAPAPVQATPARPALSLTAEPASVRAASSDQPAPTQSAQVAPPTVPSRTNSQTLTQATATPMPSFTVTAPTRTPTATPTARPTEAPRTTTPTPTATAAPRSNSPVQVSLVAGTNDFLYVGATMPADRALSSLAGFYDVIYFKPAGSAEQVAYRPGIDAVPTLPANTLVRIGMKRAMSFVMTPAQ
jgi:hypothetical protein